MFYYSLPENETVANLNCYDWSKVNSDIVFDELVITKTEDFTYLTMQIAAISGVKKAKDDAWKFPPNSKARIKLANKEYKKQDFKTKEWETIQPSRLEKALLAVLERREEETPAYRGRFQLVDAQYLDAIASGLSSDGSVCPDVVMKSFEACLLSIHPVEKLKFLTDADLKIPEGKGGFGKGGASAQKYYAVLNDRFDWIKAQMVAKYPALRIETVYDLSEQGLLEQPTTDEIKAKAHDLYRTLLEFVSGGRAS